MCKTTKGASAGIQGKVRGIVVPPAPPPVIAPVPPLTPVQPNPPPAQSPLAPELVNAAKAFKDLFDTNQASYHFANGQFAVLAAFQDALVASIFGINNTSLQAELLSLMRARSLGSSGWEVLSRDLLTVNVKIGKTYQDALPPGHPDAKGNLPIGALKSASVVNTTTAYKNATANARQLMADPSVSVADSALASAILDDTSGTGAWAAFTVRTWFIRSKIGPVSFDKLSIPRQCALLLFCLVGCGDTARYTAKQLLSTRGIVPGSIPAFADATLTSLGSKDSRSVTGNLILKYNGTALQTAINAAKGVLSAGGYLVAGCLSGKDHESFHPTIEHYILLFAASGASFLFWDPDVSVTNIVSLSLQLGPAIGMLTFDTTDPAAATFSTGEDFADLSGVDEYGNHVQNLKRHRYQIMILSKP